MRGLRSYVDHMLHAITYRLCYLSMHGLWSYVARHHILSVLSFPTRSLFLTLTCGYNRYRGGAVFVEGAESVAIERNLFKRVDGNAVLLSGYTRDVVIDSNEFTCV
jgi:hypothetical protein